jgi:hypothetical protein
VAAEGPFQFHFHGVETDIGISWGSICVCIYMGEDIYAGFFSIIHLSFRWALGILYYFHDMLAMLFPVSMCMSYIAQFRWSGAFYLAHLHTYTPDFRPRDMAFPFRFSAHPEPLFAH